MITLPGFPKCKCGNDLLPVEDVTTTNVVYLKGWLCFACKIQAIFRSGSVYIESTLSEERERR